MIVVLNPPRRRMSSTGMMSASSTMDWPADRFVRGRWTASCRRVFAGISVSLRFQPHRITGNQRKRLSHEQDARFPVVLIGDRDAKEVACAVSHIASAGYPRLGTEPDKRAPICVLFVHAGLPTTARSVGCQLPGDRVFIQPVDVDFIDLNEGLMEGRDLDRLDGLRIPSG